MHTSIITSLCLAATAVVAMPAKDMSSIHARQAPVCSGLYNTVQCCAVDVLGVADLNCADPPTVPTSGADAQKVCAAEGQQARCCVLPILGQDLLCSTPIGATS